MKVTINNKLTKNKTLEYEESLWTGKKTITYDGVVLNRIKSGTYEFKKNNIVENFVVKGNQLFGSKIIMFGNEIEIVRKLNWYEILLSILVFIPLIFFGAIGGAFGGALGITNLIIIKQVEKWYFKVIISIQFILIALLLSYILACMILKLNFWFM